jgi:hypothetical protein
MVNSVLDSADFAVAATDFVSSEYLHAGKLDELRRWYAAPSPTPLKLPGFLRPEVAEELGRVLASLPNWSHYEGIYDGPNLKTELFDDEIPDGLRGTASHRMVRDIPELLTGSRLNDADRLVLERFFTFALFSPAFQTWLKSFTELALRRVATLEFAAYQDSDGIGEHQDLVPGRVLSICFYLDRDYQESQGGNLGFRNGAGERHAMTPSFNSMSIIPIREDCWHWVEPFHAEKTGRFTIAMAQCVDVGDAAEREAIQVKRAL